MFGIGSRWYIPGQFIEALLRPGGASRMKANNSPDIGGSISDLAPYASRDGRGIGRYHRLKPMRRYPIGVAHSRWASDP